MARTSNNGGDMRTGETKASKAPAKTPARRRSDKARQAAASDSVSMSAAGVSKTVSVSAAAAAAAMGGPSEADVARLAYELYIERGCCDGYDKEDWYEAERRLREQR